MSFINNISLLKANLGIFSILAAAALGGAAPASAQGAEADCSQLSGPEEIACLRQALAQTQQALLKAEQALEASEVALGEEQAARRAGLPAPKEDQSFSAMIVAAERTHPNRLQVRLENGQIWRQIQGDTQIVLLPKNGGVAAEFTRSGFGGYRMNLPGIGRVVKVERLQ